MVVGGVDGVDGEPATDIDARPPSTRCMGDKLDAVPVDLANVLLALRADLGDAIEARFLSISPAGPGEIA